jgi:AraC-like DNA-binding protein
LKDDLRWNFALTDSVNRKSGRSTTIVSTLSPEAQDFCVEDILAMYNFVSDALVWIKDREFRYRWANRAFLLNFALANELEIFGKTDYDFAPAYLADLYHADDSRVLAGATILARVEPVGTLEALPRWNQTWKRPLRNNAGEIIGAFGLSRQLPAADAPDFPIPELVPVLNYMSAYCDQPITNSDLAELAHLSVSAFERAFKRHMQMTPNQFLNRMRITRAADDLCNTLNAIQEIAYRHGFSDQSHLTREFKKHFGKTPSEYRKAHHGHTK